jgi:hypothetical protein
MPGDFNPNGEPNESHCDRNSRRTPKNRKSRLFWINCAEHTHGRGMDAIERQPRPARHVPAKRRIAARRCSCWHSRLF